MFLHVRGVEQDTVTAISADRRGCGIDGDRQLRRAEWADLHLRNP
jgi:hypothetical protein